MTNSIQVFITENPDSKISEVARVLNHDETADKVVMLVEGVDDEAFYEQFMDPTKVYIYGMEGCEHFVEILDALTPRYPEKLAVIKDADFDHLNNTSYDNENLFLTDQHDYEMMLITPERVKAIAKDYGLHEVVAGRIYDCVVENISDYSFIKWYNSRRDLGVKGINFKSTSVVHYYGKTIAESLEILRPHQNPDVVLNQVAIESLKDSNDDVDRRQLITGHDFCNLIPKAIKDIKMQNIKNKDIPLKLMSHYSKADFGATSLANLLERRFPGIISRAVE